RFLPNGEVQTINSSNLPLAMLGGILLWFGWVGFNGGSTLAFTTKTASVIANTVIASGFGLISALIVGWFLQKYPEGTLPLNGSLGGLVAITASAHAVTPTSAAIIGTVGGIVVVLTEKFLLKLKIDDGVGAIPVHLFAGIWGTLAAGIFGRLEELGTDLSRFEQVLRQVYGIVSIGAFSFGCSYILFFIYNKISPLRVTLEEEKIGLNVSEHKAKTELIELFTVMDTQTKTGDISHDAPVEPFTEVGQIAERYNLVLKKIRATLQENEEARKEIAKAYDKVFEEQQKAEKLLLNILPAPVATQLKQSGNIIAQSFSGVTVLFADIVGFTKLASRYAPEKIVKMLDRIFSEFDLLTEKYSLEKIKTIGDAYMVAGGLPLPRADHAQAVANMALEMQKVIKRFKFTDNEPVKIRIGINSGSVVAGIIGQKKFIYDIWGDAVNLSLIHIYLASRLESTGIEGEIQISEKTKEILGEEYFIQKRGEIEIKGKGMITTYILLGKSSTKT
ncbi:MAG: guanylate cyclase, partial [Leptospiraceae bacterium]|nr:guanylate cyclase [Leptospiraceae bacterium]